MLQQYLQKQEYFIDHISFQHNQNYYHGNGIMLWNPDEGFRIMARLKRDDSIPKREEVRAISFHPPTTIRLKLSNGSRAIVPNLRIGDEIALSNRFITTVHHVIFIESNKFSSTSSHWFVSSLYQASTHLTLPEPITHETLLDNEPLAKSYSRAGLRFTDETGFQVKGKIDDKNYLLFHSRLPKSQWTRQQSMCWAQGLQEAIALVAGESTQLLSQKVYRNKHIYTDTRVTVKPTSFGIPFRPFDNDILDKNVIIRLAKLLTQNKEKGHICRQILYQLAAASQQETRAASELLLSTILEATLRTLYEVPFVDTKRENKFSIESYWKKFRKEYFSDSPENGRKWKKVTDRLIETYKRLRHRNAHPDWLTGTEGAFSPKKLNQTTDDMIFLSRFYGYMILALTGVDNLQPVFPVPNKDWKPLITIERQ